MTTHATVWTGILSSSNGALSAGYAVVKGGETYLASTTANKTTYGRSAGIAITAADATNRAFELQVAGICPNSITGLGTGSQSWVRTTAAGALERCTPASGDDVIGYCETTGDLHVMPGFPVTATVSLPLSVANGGTGASALSTGVIKSNGSVLSSTGLGTAGQVLKTNAGATDVEWGAATSVAGADTQVQFNDGGSAFGGDAGLTYNKTTDVLTVSGAVVAGSSAAGAGKIRLPNGVANGIVGKNSGGSDVDMMAVNASDGLNVWGTTAAYGNLDLSIGSGASIRMQSATVSALSVSATEIMAGVPVIGWSTPYGVHGAVQHTFASDANYTVVAAQYEVMHIEFLTGAITAGRTVTFPHPSAIGRSYLKIVKNSTTQTLTISTGTGSTQTLNTLTSRWFLFTNGGVYNASADFT